MTNVEFAPVVEKVSFMERAARVGHFIADHYQYQHEVPVVQETDGQE